VRKEETVELTNSERERLSALVASRRQAASFSRETALVRRSAGPGRITSVRGRRKRLTRPAARWTNQDGGLGMLRGRAREYGRLPLRQPAGFVIPQQLERAERAARQHRQWWPRPDQNLTFKSFITLDTATMVVAQPFSTDGVEFSVQIEPFQPQHNFVTAIAEEISQVQYGFHVPGLPLTLSIDFLFQWRPDADVAFNTLTFVQPRGQYFLENTWAAFADSTASLDYTTQLNVSILNPNGSGPTTSTGTTDNGLDRGISIGIFDFLGAVEQGPYIDESTLFDANFLGVEAGSLVTFDIGIELTLFTDGNAISLFDFQSGGDFGINVPAVYVVTFTKN
jgi:hypothetical protein